jgi:hypothetical protein
MIGFVGLYTEGLAPSKMPPCGGALAVAAVVVAEVTVVVSMSVTVLVIVAMMIDIRLTASSKGRRLSCLWILDSRFSEDRYVGVWRRVGNSDAAGATRNIAIQSNSNSYKLEG